MTYQLVDLMIEARKNARFSRLLLFCLAGLLFTTTAVAQRAPLRGSQSHLDVAVGLFSYHGRVDLTQPRSTSNFTTQSDPALVLMGSFPVIRDRLFFRGMTGLTNFSELGARGGSVTTNQFINRELLWFEPQVVLTLRRGSEKHLVPYVYSGFGVLLADPFGAPGGGLNQPGIGVPGPERSVFALPFGLGVDYAFQSNLSFFLDLSYRYNLNYAGRNHAGVHPHSTSLVMAGLRFRFARFRRTVEEIPPLKLSEPLEIPTYEPPPPLPISPPNECVLVDLNTILFDPGQKAFDDQDYALLDENADALLQSPLCCAEILGLTEGGFTDAEAEMIARERALLVYEYYTIYGVDQDRMALRERGLAAPCNRKEDPECLIHRRVDSKMIDCRDFPGFRERP